VSELNRRTPQPPAPSPTQAGRRGEKQGEGNNRQSLQFRDSLNLYLDDDTYLEPDVFYAGGDDATYKLGDDGFWYGAPALIVEVLSASTARRDRADKFLLYEKHDVREYWLVEPDTLTMEVYTLQNGQYQRHGVYKGGDQFTSSLLSATFEIDRLLGS